MKKILKFNFKYKKLKLIYKTIRLIINYIEIIHLLKIQLFILVVSLKKTILKSISRKYQYYNKYLVIGSIKIIIKQSSAIVKKKIKKK